MTNLSPNRTAAFRPGTLVLIGVSTSGATGAGERALALGPDDVVRVRDRINTSHPHLEHVLVATCDRTELFVADANGVDAQTALAVWHRALGVEFTEGHAPCLVAQAAPVVLSGTDAVEHLLRVATGLESSLLGDADVLGQLRSAFRDAESAGATGRITRQIFRDAFAVGRRARARTEISAGGAGVGTAVAEMVGAATAPILVVGAGPAGRTIARRLAKSASGPLTISNRTPQTAETLAFELGARTVCYTALDDELVRAGTVVTAVAAPSPILTAQRLIELRTRRPEWSPTIIDVGAPPNVERASGFDIVGLDGLAERSAALDDRRTAAIPAVEAFISDMLQRRYRSTQPSPHTAGATHLAGTNCRLIARRSSQS